MEAYFEILRKCGLFRQIEGKKLPELLDFLNAQVKSYRKSQTILREGEAAVCIGVILSGTAQIIRIDYYGNRSIVAKLEAGELFGEAFACACTDCVPVSVAASESCEVMLIDSRRIFLPCENTCSFQGQLISNLVKIIAAKNLFLNRKIEIISRRTTREKLTAYLLWQAKQHDSSSFTIPFDRQELADFLCVDRSGLSAEISKLKNEGIIECSRKWFRLTNRISASSAEDASDNEDFIFPSTR